MKRARANEGKRRRLTVFLGEKEEAAARVVLAARCLEGKRPALGTALCELLQQEAKRLQGRGAQ